MLGSPILSEDGSFTALAGEFQIAKSTRWKLPAQKHILQRVYVWKWGIPVYP